MTKEIKEKKRTYGHFQKRAEDKTRCIEEVWDRFTSYQCSRKRGYGKNGLYCKQHAKQQTHFEE